MYLLQQAIPTAVKVEADDNLLQYIETDVDGNNLHL